MSRSGSILLIGVDYYRFSGTRSNLVVVAIRLGYVDVLFNPECEADNVNSWGRFIGYVVLVMFSRTVRYGTISSFIYSTYYYLSFTLKVGLTLG